MGNGEGLGVVVKKVFSCIYIVFLYINYIYT